MASTAPPQAVKSSEEAQEAPAAPDSTTSMFVEGEDVLVDRQNTGRFFMGTIVRIEHATERCLLRFLDNKECWAHLNELQHMKDDPAERLCVICKKTGTNVVPCSKCGRGYHRTCQQSNIPEGALGSKWLCRRCDEKPAAKKRTRQSKELVPRSEKVRKSGKAQVLSTAPHHSASSSALKLSSSHLSSNATPSASPLLPSTSGVLLQSSSISKHQHPRNVQELPYDLTSLSWDELKQVNEEQCYCYCGQPGDWFLQMLQCAQCNQWFHQHCITNLHYPIYCGDRFYVFLCSICNGGEEFVRRLEMKWVDILHLCIFNLMLFSAKKYFDLDREIIPFMKENWFYLQLPDKMFHCSDADLKEIAFRTLRGNILRFKCGREIKMRTAIWGLRSRSPPAQPDFSLPQVRPMSDSVLNDFWNDNPQLTYIPAASPKYLMKDEVVLQPDGKMSPYNYELMLGGPRSVQVVSSRTLRQAAIGLHLLKVDSPSGSATRVPVNGEKVCIKSVDNCGGYAKKSSGYRAPNRLTLQETLLRQNRRSLKNAIPSLRKRVQTKGLQLTKKTTGHDGSDSPDSQASEISQDEGSHDGGNTSEYEVSHDEESQEDTEVSQDGVTSQDGQSSQDSSSEDESSSEDDSLNSLESRDANWSSPALQRRTRSFGKVHTHEGEHEDEETKSQLQEHEFSESDGLQSETIRNEKQLKEESLLKEERELDQELERELENVHERVREQELEKEVQEDPLPVKEEHEHIVLMLTPPPSGAPNTPQPSASPGLIVSTLNSNLATPADTEAEDDGPGPSEPQIRTFRTVAELLGGPVISQPKQIPRLIPSLPPLTPVINEPPPARTIKRKLSEKDIKIVNGEVKRKRMRRVQSSHVVGTKTVQLDSGEKIEKRIVGGKLLRSPHKPNASIPDPFVPEDIQARPENTSSTSAAACTLSASTSACTSAAVASSSINQPSEISRNIKKSVTSYFSAVNRIAAGEKFRIRGKRTTGLGTEYLIEWEYPPL